MRILFIANDFPSPVLPTKAVFNGALVRALAGAGHGVEVIAPIPWTEEWAARASMPRPREEIVDGNHLQHPRYLYPPKLLRQHHGWFYWRSIRRAVRRSFAAGKPDVVLGYWLYPDGDAAVRAARIAGVPSAVIVGGSDVLLLPDDTRRRRRVLEVLRRVDRVITVNQHLRTATAALGIDPEKIVVWSQGIDPARFSPGDRAAARAVLHLDADETILLWVGRLVPVKGTDLLIETAAMLRDRGVAFRLVIIGDGPLRERVRQDTAGRGIADRVQLVGAVAPERLGDWYHAADRVLLSSRSEGLPNVLREAQACGIPFVSVDVGGVREIAGPADRLCAPGRAAALADAVQQSLAQPTIEAPLPATTTWDQSARALVDVLSAIPAPTLPERAPAWTPRQLMRRMFQIALPRGAMLSEGPRDSGQLCLTFDDGPTEQTPALLDVLGRCGVKATFFVIGERVAALPHLVRRMAAEGHTVAHHTYTHGEPHTVSAELLAREIQQSDDAFVAAGVKVARVFRPPYGKLSPAKLAAVWRAKLSVVLWSRDSKDYLASITTAELTKRFTDRPLRSGDIALFHEHYPATVDVMPTIVESARAAGLSFTTVDRWISHRSRGPLEPFLDRQQS